MTEMIRRPTADRDLVTTYRYYSRRAGSRVADRFFAQVEATFSRLARMPGLGMRYESGDPSYPELRYFPVSRFRDYLVFYRPLGDGIEVFRVLHGARDIRGILADDFGGTGEGGGDEAMEGRDE